VAAVCEEGHYKILVEVKLCQYIPSVTHCLFTSHDYLQNRQLQVLLQDTAYDGFGKHIFLKHSVFIVSWLTDWHVTWA